MFMKKIVLFIIFSSIILFAQNKSTKSLLELKQQINLQMIPQNDLLKTNGLEKKNTGLAILYSALLPGMGELYAGDYSLGKYLTIADGVFWGFFAGFTIYGNNQENNYKAFAQSFGKVIPQGKDDKYYATIGDYISIDQYNRVQELNRNFDKTLDPVSDHWDWKDNPTRKEYRDTWSSSEQAKNNIRFAVGALILNRIVSVINAVRLVSKHNKMVSEQLSWNISFGISNPQTFPGSFNVNFVKVF